MPWVLHDSLLDSRLPIEIAAGLCFVGWDNAGNDKEKIRACAGTLFALLERHGDKPIRLNRFCPERSDAIAVNSNRWRFVASLEARLL